MSETTELATATSTPVRREFARVESAMGIMDTARFEHLGRVAQVMARAGLMPMTLTHEKDGPGDNAKLIALPYEVVVARAYLIANQADLWNADPNAVAQCTSIVHGKLMYEGKLVHGIISAKLGMDLIYELGTYDAAKRDIKGALTFTAAGERVWEGQIPGPDDQSLGVRVVGFLPGETVPRTIVGSVGMWHKGAKSPWSVSTAWPRQLRYMGAREWARAHKPSLLLGIITDDEIEEYDLARQVGHIAPAGPQALHAGFADQRQIEAPKSTDDAKTSVASKRAARAKATEKLQDAIRASVGMDAPKEVETPASDAAAALDGDDLPEGLRATPPTGTDGAQDAEFTPATSEIATSAVSGGAEGTSGATVSEEVEPGHAPMDEVYLMADSLPLEDGRRVTFRNGERFSSVSAQGQATMRVFAEHAPLVKTEEEQVEETLDNLPAEMPEDVKAFALQVKGEAEDFNNVKKALADLQKTAWWGTATEDDRNEVRYNTWDIMEANGLAAKLQPHLDISAFRLWLEWEEDPEAIEAMLVKVEDDPGFKGKSDAMKEMVRGAAQNRIEALAE